MINPIKGDIVDFNFVNDVIMGGKITGATVSSGVMDYGLAVQLDSEIGSKHTNLFTYFKDKVGNVDDPAAYDYFAIRDANGKQHVFGIPWILDNTFTPVRVRQVTYIIHNFQEHMRSTINEMLLDLGASYTSKDNVE